MSPWPTIALIALGLFLAFLLWFRVREGHSAEFGQYTTAQKVQTLALIYAGAFVLTAVAWGAVLLIMRTTAPGIEYY